MIPAGAHIVTDPEELAAHFADEPGAHVYALGDLDEPFWSASTWYRRGDGVVGVVRLPDDEGTAVYAVATRDPQGSLALLLDVLPQLAPGQLITGPTGMGQAIGARRRLAWSGPHVRYRLVQHRPADSSGVVPLGRHDLDDVTALYATEPGAAFFLPHMLGDETFVGVRDEAGWLVAVAGTHLFSDRRDVAAIGAVYTHPDHRGRGLGRSVTAGVIERIGDRASRIGLNVAADNHPARAIYERLGFEAVLDYEECELAE